MVGYKADLHDITYDIRQVVIDIHQIAKKF